MSTEQKTTRFISPSRKSPKGGSSGAVVTPLIGAVTRSIWPDPYVIYLGNDSKGMFKLQSDCEKSRTIFLEINGTHISGKWVKMKPGSRGESIIMAACNM